MGSITPEKYQAYVRGEISREEAEKPLVPTPTPSSTPSSSPSSNPYNAAYGAPTNSVPVPPPTGYGGANYNTADSETRAGIEANENRLNTDSSFRDSEIARTLGVIEERKKQGMDIADQNNYLYNRLGYTVPAPQQPKPMASSYSSSPSSSVPAPGTINTQSIQNEAAAQMAKRRAALQQAVSSTMTSLKNTYDYNNQLKNDARTLENVEFKRNTNPFSGKTDHLTSQLNRNRTIQDTAIDKDYQSNVAAAQQKLADFDSLAPEQQQALVNELTRIEREYGLNVGQLMGTFNGQRTLAGSAQDANFLGVYNGQQTLQAQNQAFQQQLAMAQLMGTYNGQSTLAGKQANLDAALSVGQQLGQVVQPKSDWSHLYNQNGAPNYQAQQDAIKNGQWQQQFDTGNSQWQQQFEYAKQQDAAKLAQSAQQFAAQMGVDYARLNQSQQQFMQELAFKQQQLGAQGMKSTDYKTNPDFAQDVADLQSMNPTDAQKIITQQAQAFITAYGYDGYLALQNMFKDQY